MLLYTVVLLATTALAQIEPERDYTSTQKFAGVRNPRLYGRSQPERSRNRHSRQLVRYQSRNLSGKITMGGKVYPQRLAKESLLVFQQLVRNFKACTESQPLYILYQTLNAEIRNRFDVFAPDLQPGLIPVTAKKRQLVYRFSHALD